MGNPRPMEGTENLQSGTCISLLSDFLRKKTTLPTALFCMELVNEEAHEKIKKI